MEAIKIAIQILGGLAMFLYGMEIMGDGLKQSSGTALKNVLGKLTNNVVLGVITGALVTGVIQSSTATIVLTVGLIGAGILNFRQAVGIVMGANIGTTVTAQLLRLMDIKDTTSIISFLKPDTLAPIALIIGIILVMFLKKDIFKNVGTIAMGFGILFIGLESMSDAVTPLTESAMFDDIITKFSNMPVVGILIGIVTTVIVQSSSAMVGIIQTLATQSDSMTFELVYPIIMGINIGTCVTTAMVCSIGTSKDAKRTGIVHIVFNTVGTIAFMIAMTLIRHFGGFPSLWEAEVNSGDIANFQTLFNLITAVMLLPFTSLLVYIANIIIKDNEEEETKYPELAALDSKLMIAPKLALGEVSKIAVNMIKTAKESISISLEQFDGYSYERKELLDDNENKLDCLTDGIDNYLIQMSNNIEMAVDNRERNMLMQCTRDIERIGDYAIDFDHIAKRMADSELSFSDSAKEEIAILSDAVQEILRLTIEALETDNDYVARRIEPLEEVIDDMVLLLKNRHTERLCQGICSIDSGLCFMDMLTYFERTADQCSSMAMLILARSNEEIMKNHHLYLHELHASGDQSYNAEQENRRVQYLVPLENMKYLYK